MDGCLESTRNSADQQSLGTSGNTVHQASQSLNSLFSFKSQKPPLSYADLHHEITKNVKHVLLVSDGNRQKQSVDRNTTEADELVKYMSKLPSYLQRGNNLQEKALNVGVIDWGRLQNWQDSHKQMPYRNSRYSPSSSNTTSSFSTDESSPHSTRGHSCSPARHRMHHPSLQSHVITSPPEGPSEVVKSSRGSVRKFPDLEADQSGDFNGLEKFIIPDKSFIKVEQCKKKDSDPKTKPGNENLRNGVYHEMAATDLRVKKNSHDAEFLNKIVKSQQSFSENDSEGRNKIVLLLPRDLPERNHSRPGRPHTSDSDTLGQRAAETSRLSLPERPKGANIAELNSGLPHSCRFPSEIDHKHFRVKHLGSTGVASGSFHSDMTGSASQLPLKFSTGSSPSRARIPENKKATGVSSTSTDSLRQSDLKPVKVTAEKVEKVRSSSPFRRLSIAVGKMSKVSSAKDSWDVQQLRSTAFQSRSGTGNNAASTFLDTSDADKANATNRARSSPLKRLLDPLLKPKVANCDNSVEPLLKDSVSTNQTGISSRRLVESLSEQQGKVKLCITGCKGTDVHEFSTDKKARPSAVQALLRVAVKNGHPLFTFALHNDTDILAATMKKRNSTGKGDRSCVYTFFSLRKVKKKHGTWLNHGSKGKGHEYIRNVIAQMKVSDSQFPNLIKLDQFSVRKFVLFSVNLKQADSQTSDYQPNDELAATVVKIPKLSHTSSTDGRQSDTSSGLPPLGSEECLSKVRCNSYSVEDAQRKQFIGSQGLICTTVILPSGAHSLPSYGGPSSLIERWSTGGSCDCGGWDLGCQLRILENQSQASGNLTPHKVCSIPGHVELYHQGVQDNHPALSLGPCKYGVNSVEFNSSLSVLQAFSICISVLDSRNLCEFSEFWESKVTVQDGDISDPNQAEGEVPARYASYPPVSPVGRV